MSHWNPRTGEVFAAPRGKARTAAAEAFEARLFDDEDWIEVPCLESDVGHAMAVAFADGLRPGRGRTAVRAALAGPKPFRALREAMAGKPGIQRRYRRMLEEEASGRLVEFCVSQRMLLLDARFDAMLDALDAAATAAEMDDGDVEPVPPMPTAAARRAVASLSIGRSLGDDDE